MKGKLIGFDALRLGRVKSKGKFEFSCSTERILVSLERMSKWEKRERVQRQG